MEALIRCAPVGELRFDGFCDAFPEAEIALAPVLQSEQMRNTLSVRLPDDLAEWLEATSRKTGVPRGRIIRDQLQRARTLESPPFMRLAGTIDGPRDLSTRKGFSKK